MARPGADAVTTPRHTRVHLVVVQPHMADAGAEVVIRSAMDDWRASNPWLQDGMSAWVDVNRPGFRGGCLV
jgi:hypothetical protein